MKKISILLLLLVIGLSSNAQTPLNLAGTSYMQDFDNLSSGLPIGWRVDTAADQAAGLGGNALSRYIATNSAWNVTSRGFYNFAAGDATGLTAGSNTADQSAATDRALGVKQVSAWDMANGQVSFNLMLANTTGLSNFAMTFKLQTFFQISGRNNTWIVQYGLGATPATFTTVTTTPTTLYVDSTFTNTLVNVNFGAALDNQTQNVWIRFIPVGLSQGLGNRPIVGIDDVQLNWTGSAAGNPKPSIVGLSPSNNATNVPITSNLVMTFDKNITVGTGNITITNLTDATNQTIALPNANVTVSGMSATIAGNTFGYAKNYMVRFDSTCFVNGVNNSFGIYDSITWKFTTGNAPITAQTSLNETFTGCLDPQFGLFTDYSAIGNQDWRCSFFGRNDSNAVFMNGYSAGASQNNDDWLISPPLNVSAMSNPYLHFWSKKRFNGTNTKAVYASTNYAGSGDPSLATWTNLNVSFTSLDTIWKQFLNADLSSYSANNFHLAFRYESTSTGTADEWSLDDITITDGPLGLNTFTTSEFNAYILGSVNDQINVQIQSAASRKMLYSIVDISGKKIQEGNIEIAQGKATYSIDAQVMNNGMYFLQLIEGSKKMNMKFIVR